MVGQKNRLNNMQLSVIIVHYKTPQLLLDCVTSLWEFSDGVNLEVVVVDNDSKDESEKLILNAFPQTKWIQSGYNAGFARANNLGIRNSTGEYILLLNPDTFVKEEFLEKMLEKYKQLSETKNLGLLGCRIISSVDGTLLVGTGRGFQGFSKYLKANPLVIKFFPKYVDKKKYNAEKMHYKNHEVDFVSGACVMMKREKIENHKLYLDEDFFLYYEDVEWSFRVKKEGFINYFLAATEVYHVNSASTDANPMKNKVILASEFLYLYKTMSYFQFWLLKRLLFVNIQLNTFFLKRRKLEDLLSQEKEYSSQVTSILARIENNYLRKTSSAKSYLKYAE
jgi:GT2 family glycosyltransferase